jgi:hypothetical protein
MTKQKHYSGWDKGMGKEGRRSTKDEFAVGILM